jgi:protein-tyrosine phosphatase
MLKKLSEANLENDHMCDSAGTSGFHNGHKADERMIDHAARRGIELPSLSRKFSVNDFDSFDLILVMDRANEKDVLALARNDQDKNKVRLMLSYGENGDYDEVPDPYYGGPSGFDLVLDLLDESCDNLLKDLG